MGRHLSETEALLWNLGHHPNLGSTMGAMLVLDGNPEPDRVRRTVAKAVAAVPGLHEAVLDSGVALTSPTWHVDTAFDLDHHLRFLRPAGSSLSRATDLAVQIINDPFDRTRPLWQMTVISGLSKKTSIVVMKLHHAIADAQGALQLATEFLQFEPDSPAGPSAAPGISDDELNDALARLADGQAPRPRGLGDTLRVGAEHFAASMGHAAAALNDPSTLIATGTDAFSTAKTMGEGLAGSEDKNGQTATPSPDWGNRSRNRRYYHLAMPLEMLKQAAKANGASVNDLFMVACAEASLAHHQRRGTQLDSVAAATVISTRGDGTEAASNAVIPVPVTIPGHQHSTEERFAAVQGQVGIKRQAAGAQPDLLSTLGGFAGLIPSSITAAVALDQAAKIDIATSNIPGPPLRVWFAGQEITSALPVGPVLGTGMNVTMLSFQDKAVIGLTIDPVAVTDHLAFSADLVVAFKRLGVSAVRSR